jgi:glycosyltransferase involved in cell wall biosynthesis
LTILVLDNSVEIINSYQDPRIRLFKNEKDIGQVASLNIGLGLAKGKYIARLDQDDVCLPKRLEEQVDFMQKNPAVAIVASWEYTIDSEGNKIGVWKQTIEDYGTFLGFILLGLCPVWHPSISFWKQSMLDAGGFNHDYLRAEDFEVTTRLALKRYSAAVIQEFHLLQRQHDDRQSIEFCDVQQEVTRRIHNEAVENFLGHPDAKILAAFLRLEGNPICGKRNKENIKIIDILLKDLFAQVKEKQELTDVELKSFKRIIFKRIGVGIKYTAYLTWLPSFLFLPTFYLLSPQQLPEVRKYALMFYHNVIRKRYFVK